MSPIKLNFLPTYPECSSNYLVDHLRYADTVYAEKNPDFQVQKNIKEQFGEFAQRIGIDLVEEEDETKLLNELIHRKLQNEIFLQFEANSYIQSMREGNALKTTVEWILDNRSKSRTVRQERDRRNTIEELVQIVGDRDVFFEKKTTARTLYAAAIGTPAILTGIGTVFTGYSGFEMLTSGATILAGLVGGSIMSDVQVEYDDRTQRVLRNAIYVDHTHNEVKRVFEETE